MKFCTFLLYSINFFNLVTTAPLQYALEGTNITLKTGINAQDPPDEMLWKHNGNKVVEFNGQQQLEFSPFKNRLTLNWHTADLEIKNLQDKDSGDYLLEAFSKTILKKYPFTLQVIEPLPKPSISCVTNGEGNATLTCSAEVKRPESRSNLEFSWVPPGKEQSSQKLEIKLGGQMNSEVYECTVRNQKSEESASFTAKDCYPAKDSPAGLIVGICVILLVLVLIGLFFLYRKGSICKKDANTGHYDEEKQAASGGAIVKEGNGGKKEEHKHLLGREETMPSNQPLPQWKIQDESKKDTKEDLEETQNTKANPPVAAKPSRASFTHRGDKIPPDSEKQQQENPSTPSQPPLKPSRSMVQTPKIQSHSEEGEVNGDAEEEGPENKPPFYEKATDVKPEEIQHEVSPSPLQPPLKPSRSMVRTPKSQSHSKEEEVNGDAKEKGPENEPPPTEKTSDVEPGPEKNIHPPLFPVSVEVHSPSTSDTEKPNEKELIKDTETKVSESDPPGPKQKTDADSDSEKNEKVSSPPSVLPKTNHASVNRKESNEPAEKEENPEENASGIDPSVPEKTPDVSSDSQKNEKVSSPPPVAPKTKRISVNRKESNEPAEKGENPEENASGIDPPVLEKTPDVSSVTIKESNEPAEKAENPEENASGIDPSVPEKTPDVSPDSQKNKKVSPPVPPKTKRASVTRKESNKPAEKAENPEENASGIDPSVPEKTPDVSSGPDVSEDEHKQPEFSSDSSVSAPAGPPASPLTQKVPKTPPNKAAEREEDGSTDQASAEPIEKKAEEPQPKDLERTNKAVNEVKTPAPPTPPGAQTGAEEDEQVPPAEDDDDTPKKNGHELDPPLDEETNETYKTPPNSPELKHPKPESDSSTEREEDEGKAAKYPQ
ncbi:cell surface glycoprotein 1 isoform X3 [Oryzias melastigma]|uniref:cell surface glycoprotein 1 isoform X3 n=1 Tax=Oryzias melastigma TaxID=30732 RepID=UPI000CF7BF41|nr:cell surface glycoprotein 1 isoform X3 [Oryzias melastigma]